MYPAFIKQLLQTKQKQETGQGLVEYALILVLVAVVSIVILTRMGPAVGNVFSDVLIVMQSNASAENNAAEEEEEETSDIFSGTITASDQTDGFRYYDVCSFTVTETGTYSITGLSTNKGSNFWVTAGSGNGPASGFSMETDKGGAKSTGTLTEGQTYRAYPHSITPGDFPVSYEFTFSGPGAAQGGC